MRCGSVCSTSRTKSVCYILDPQRPCRLAGEPPVALGVLRDETVEEWERVALMQASRNLPGLPSWVCRPADKDQTSAGAASLLPEHSES